jgi:hypothetical protein
MKSFFPYGERHGEESQEDNKEEEGQEEVILESIHFFVREQQTSLRREQ